MFWRRNKSQGPEANRLRTESRPNELTRMGGAANDFRVAGPADDDEIDGTYVEDLAPDDADDAEYDPDLDPDGEVESALTFEEREARRVALQAELQRQAEEFGLTDSNPIAYFGPNGKEVGQFLDRLADLGDDELEDVFDAWEGRSSSEKRLVGIAVRSVIHASDLATEVDAARTAVNGWVEATIRDTGNEEGEDEAFYRAVARAVADAATALVLRDELDPADFESLGGPWAEEVASRPEGQPKPTPSRELRSEGDRDAEEDGEFGPNTGEVVELLDRLDRLSPEQLSRLTAALRAQAKAGLRAAHRDVEELVDEDPAWRDQLRRAQDQVTSWINREVSGVSQVAWGLPAKPLVRPAAAPAIADAISALVLSDLLEPQNAELLYAPWAATVGAPPLPIPDEEEE